MTRSEKPRRQTAIVSAGSCDSRIIGAAIAMPRSAIASTASGDRGADLLAIALICLTPGIHVTGGVF